MSSIIAIIGVPMDLGQSRRGVDMGPAAVRYAGILRRLKALGCTVHDRGNVELPVRDSLPEKGGLAYLPAVAEACRAVYEEATIALEAGQTPIFLGGDHSIAVGTVAAMSATGTMGVLWIDAHADFNVPETSPSGNLHGMPLAALTGNGAPELVDLGRPGRKIEPGNAMLIGVRDLDRGEREMLQRSEVGVYTMREIDERGLATVTREALERIAHCDSIHVSLDMDSLDPSEAPGVGTPVPGGLTYREAHLLMEIVASEASVGSMDVVEINPILDLGNRTAELAIGLVASALGKTIL